MRFAWLTEDNLHHHVGGQIGPIRRHEQAENQCGPFSQDVRKCFFLECFFNKTLRQILEKCRRYDRQEALEDGCDAMFSRLFAVEQLCVKKHCREARLFCRREWAAEDF